MAWGTWREGSAADMDPHSNGRSCDIRISAWSLAHARTHTHTRTRTHTVSLQLMCQWLLSSELTTPPETELVEWVLTQVPVMSSATEVCPVCGEDVPLSNLLQEICCNGHSWSECSFTAAASHVMLTPDSAWTIATSIIRTVFTQLAGRQLFTNHAMTHIHVHSGFRDGCNIILVFIELDRVVFLSSADEDPRIETF